MPRPFSPGPVHPHLPTPGAAQRPSEPPGHRGRPLPTGSQVHPAQPRHLAPQPGDDPHPAVGHRGHHPGSPGRQLQRHEVPARSHPHRGGQRRE
ncbi:hypothetical protein llap_22803 [Limosa lapponica baueri]|uniref:Uncharacterized protein n=1 Tax=Limosa lapponica baueri TaxID=1758121 RepID=A0A2I0SZC2_LIMLA|nr:hypothetical protein llap_22803 [Limosa lapponica baueri]